MVSLCDEVKEIKMSVFPFQKVRDCGNILDVGGKESEGAVRRARYTAANSIGPPCVAFCPG